MRIIGSPLMPVGRGLLVDKDEASELYQLAVRNKIPLLYLEALRREGKLPHLESEYGEEKKRYQRFTEAIRRVSKTLNAENIEHVVFKTIKPYPAVPVDIDILTLGDNDMYRRAVEVLLRAGYPPQTPDVVSMADLTDDKAYQRATELLTRPTYGKRHVSPTGTDFLDPEHGIDIDLQKELALSFIIYLDKSNFGGHVTRVRLNGQEVCTLAPELDLLVVIAHSLMEQLYLLGECYGFLYHLSRMDEEGINRFIAVVRENRLEAAVRAFTAVTAELHRAAYSTVPGKLEFVLNELGVDTEEAGSLLKKGFKTPHRYQVMTLAKVFWEKAGEKKFRRSLAKQMIKTLDPSLARLVIRELTDRLKRETYLEEAEAGNQR